MDSSFQRLAKRGHAKWYCKDLPRRRRGKDVGSNTAQKMPLSKSRLTPRF